MPSATRPLIVLLDGLDQLGSAHRAHSLAWLPTSLSPHVRLLLSTLQQADKYDLLHTLKALLSPWYVPANACYVIEPPPLSNASALSLWPPYVIGGPLYFSPVVSFLLPSSIFFPRLISAAVDRMSAILLHMAWP